MKKFLATILTAAILTASVCAEVTFSAYNKLSSEVVGITLGDNPATSFAGFQNKASASFLSDKVDAGITASCFLNSDDTAFGLLGYKLNDWYIEFRPFSILTVGFHDTINTPGSYLPIEDDNLSAGNLGSDLVLVLRPITGLRIAAGADFNSYFNSDAVKPYLNFGVDYAYSDIGAVGVTFRNVLNSFECGAFVSFKKVDGLTVNLGYSYNNAGIESVAGNLLSLGLSYEKGAFGLYSDVVTNFKGAGADLYAGLCGSYSVTDKVSLSLTGTVVTGFDEGDDSVYLIEPDFAYTTGAHKFSAGVKTVIADTCTISFPVYWKYTF